MKKARLGFIAVLLSLLFMVFPGLLKYNAALIGWLLINLVLMYLVFFRKAPEKEA